MSRESEAREMLARHMPGCGALGGSVLAMIEAAMLEFAAHSTPVQSAASTFHETGELLKVAEAVREALRPIIDFKPRPLIGNEGEKSATLGWNRAGEWAQRVVTAAIRAMTLDTKGAQG